MYPAALVVFGNPIEVGPADTSMECSVPKRGNRPIFGGPNHMRRMVDDIGMSAPIEYDIELNIRSDNGPGHTLLRFAVFGLRLMHSIYSLARHTC